MVILPADFAAPETEKFIRGIGRKNFKSIGFIPMEGIKKNAAAGRVLTLQEAGEFLGYIYFSPRRGNARQIQQIIVRDDARRLEYGRALLGAVPAPVKLARCAADIEGVNFWRGIGGRELYRVRPATYRRREIIGFAVGDAGGLLL